MEKEKNHHSNFRIVYNNNLVDDVYNYIPVNCFFVDSPEDPLKIRLAFSLSSILYTLYTRIPKALEYVSDQLKFQPIKYNLDDLVDVGHIMYSKRILIFFCRLCPDRGLCPWHSVLVSLKIS
ncbi:MAG: hypothetical protein QXK54_04385 [Ignisphaera sp.]